MKSVFGWLLFLVCFGVCIWQVVGFIQDCKKKKQLTSDTKEKKKDDEEKKS